ncbi:hypothetical protein AFIC_001032 [[Pseudomonas] carboxydohydrogena]|uniref:Uncharacterized protein n=1 Tax=Afipia carboxydohydrogena TaxID=290 RepID=A0ABY8BSF6_AFICR|nr:hypothetical protein [[Pseudomonas] carboxydohydrogena]WEF52541.1 hypothetical protein AFIC_001032 [[Pseudomonas] carboxydohydrogena]
MKTQTLKFRTKAQARSTLAPLFYAGLINPYALRRAHRGYRVEIVFI